MGRHTENPPRRQPSILLVSSRSCSLSGCPCDSCLLGQGLHPRSRLAPQDFVKNYGEVVTVALPSVPLGGFTRFVAKPVAKFFVLAKTPNDCSKFGRVGGIVKDYAINTVGKYFR